MAAAPTVQRHWDKQASALSQAEQAERQALDPARATDSWAGTDTASLSDELREGLTLAKANPDPADWQSGMPWLNEERPTKTGTTPIYLPKHKSLAQHSWGSTHNNNSGLLPGVKGAGGYVEYYARPATDLAAYWQAHQKQPLGKNRIIKQVNVSGKTYWWASPDHYNSYRFVNDA